MIFSASDWYKTVRFHYYRHQNLTFDDFWISEALEPRIYGFYYTKILQKIQGKLWKHPGNNIIFHISNFRNLKIQHFPKRRAPKNDEDPSKNFLKILDTYVFHIYQKHEMGIW